MNKKFVSPLILLTAAMIWGFAFAAQDAVSEMGAFTLGFSRSILAGVFLIFVIMALDKVRSSGRRLFSSNGVDINKTELIGGIICGAVLATASAFQQIGINKGTDGGKAAFITALYVILVPIYALAIKKKAPLNVWVSVFIAMIGFYFLCITDNMSIAGSDIMVIIGSMIFPIHILAIDHFSPKCDGVRMSMIQFYSAAIINLVIALLTESPINFSCVVSNALPIIYLGIGSSGIAYTLQIVGQKGVNPAVAAVILSLESVFGILGTALFLGQSLSSREYIGCAIVLVAVILSQIPFQSKKKRCE